MTSRAGQPVPLDSPPRFKAQKKLPADPKPGPVAGGGPSQRNQGGGGRRRRRRGDIRGEGPPPATGPVGRRRCLRSNASRKKPGARPGCFASGKVYGFSARCRAGTGSRSQAGGSHPRFNALREVACRIRSRVPSRVVGLRSEIREEAAAAGGGRGTFAEKARHPRRDQSDGGAASEATHPGKSPAQGRAVSQAEGARLQRTLPRRNRFTIASRMIAPISDTTKLITVIPSLIEPAPSSGPFSQPPISAP